VEADFAQEIFVIDIGVVATEIDRSRLARDCKAFFNFIAKARGSAKIPFVHVGVICPQPFVNKARERSWWSRRRVLGGGVVRQAKHESERGDNQRQN
jgi:hypothetical protein